MKTWQSGLFAVGLALLVGNAIAEEEMRRFRLIPFTEMTPAQRAYADAVMSGPVAATGSAAVVPGAATIGSPFNVYLRSPELAQQLRKVGEQVRFKSSLPARLNEFAILVTARHWGSQYEWFAHHRLALKAGLSPSVAEDLAQGGGRRACKGNRAASTTFPPSCPTSIASAARTSRRGAGQFADSGGGTRVPA